MILRSLQPLYWGPFYYKTILEIDSEVTVITGSNDTGKSSLLRLIDAIYRWPKAAEIAEYDFNLSHRDLHAASNWENDTAFGAIATFTATENSNDYFNSVVSGKFIKPGDEITITFNLAPKSRTVSVKALRNNQPVSFPAALSIPKMPHIIGMPTGHQVRDIIPLTNPNHAERLLLRVAFGGRLDAALIASYSKPIFLNKIREAENRLNRAMTKIVPSTMNLTFTINAQNPTEVSIQPVDQEFGYAPIGARGSGVRTMMTLLASLLEYRFIDQQLLIYIDEPETSLHADAQHMLRSLLEEIAASPKVQVIYTTHSSPMINNMRPESVRLLKRAISDERVYSAIDNRPIDKNFASVRSNLGMSPSDSLLYAPVTIIAEGPTDTLCIPLILRQLASFKAEGFDEYDVLVSKCHIIDGEGDSFKYHCKIARSQGTQPILFLDGDKRLTEQQKREIGNTKVILLDPGEEIEEVIPVSIYFLALAEILAEEENFKPEISITLENFNEWIVDKDQRITRRAFSKRIEAWLEDQTERPPYVKPAVMKRAISKITELSQVKTRPFQELMAEISRLAHLSPDTEDDIIAGGTN